MVSSLGCRASAKRYSFLVITACILAGNQVHAGGFYVAETLGTASAGNPTENRAPVAAYVNPAGMTGIERDAVLSTVQIIVPETTFDVDRASAGGDDGGSVGLIAAVPSAFYVRALSERARFGFSLTAPLGGGVDYGNNFVGRYSANKATLAGLGISPSFGYRVNDRFSVGVGVTAVYTLFEEEISIRQRGRRKDAEVSFDKVDGWGWQGFAGMTFKLNDRAHIGVVYRSESETDISGDVDFNGLKIPFAPLSSIEVEWTLPQLVDVGIRYRLNDKYTLMANADWEDWSVFSENQLTVAGTVGRGARVIDRNWKDTYHLGVGLLYQPAAGHNLTTGVSYDSSPVDDEDRTFDLPVDEQFKVSFAYFRTPDGPLSYGLAATFMYAGENAIDQTSQGVRARGKFDNNLLLILGANVRYKF